MNYCCISARISDGKGWIPDLDASMKREPDQASDIDISWEERIEHHWANDSRIPSPPDASSTETPDQQPQDADPIAPAEEHVSAPTPPLQPESFRRGDAVV
jgi:hypothetical protein